MGDTCDVCGTPHRLGELTLRGILTITCCVWCHEDDKRLTDWLAGEMEKALEEDPNAVRLPDGRWTFIDAPPST